MNSTLAEALEAHFRPYGIVAYSRCCTIGCSGSYNEDDDHFQWRKTPGISYFKLYLSGMNYDPEPEECFVEYENWQYLEENWDAEKQLIHDWCNIVLGSSSGVEIIEPEDGTKAITVRFPHPLQLDQVLDEDEDEEEVHEHEGEVHEGEEGEDMVVSSDDEDWESQENVAET